MGTQNTLTAPQFLTQVDDNHIFNIHGTAKDKFRVAGPIQDKIVGIDEPSNQESTRISALRLLHGIRPV